MPFFQEKTNESFRLENASSLTCGFLYDNFFNSCVNFMHFQDEMVHSFFLQKGKDAQMRMSWHSNIIILF